MKLTWDKVAEIRSRHQMYNLCRGNAHELAAEFGVNASTIARIVKGQTWKLAPKKPPATVSPKESESKEAVGT